MKLIDFEKQLKVAKTLSQLNIVLKNYLSQLGITTFAYTYYSYYPNALNKLKYDFSTPDFSLWHDHYISENYEEVDSTLETVYRTTMPTFWNLQQQLKEARNRRERQMRLDSIKFGVVQGLSIPIHGPQEDFAILLLVQKKGQRCLENWQEVQYELFSAAYCYYFYAEKLVLKTRPKINKHDLTAREIECLTLIAQENPVEIIAKKLKITPRTVHYYSQRINKKLGTRNKYQSVLKALQKNLIHF